jgi:hypothetical protein
MARGGFLPKVATHFVCVAGCAEIERSSIVRGIQPQETAGILPAEDAGRTSAGAVVPTACKCVLMVSRLAVGVSSTTDR